MKTIIVPIDFSQPAKDAARYALHVAKYLNASITLCHAIVVPVNATVAGQVSWPMYDYESVLKDASESLEDLAKSLMHESESVDGPSTYMPKLEYVTETSGPADLVSKLFKKKQARMVVSGVSGAGALSKFFAGSTSRALIEKAEFPLLLIPSECIFKPLKKIAFATDLNSGDIAVLHSLVSFARYFDAELVVVHIDDNPAKYDAKKADAFLNDITCKINYDKIYYRELTSGSVTDGLDWLSEHGWIDMLVMVHRHNSFTGRLLKGSLTKKQAGRIEIPMLVLPEGTNTVF